MNRLEKNSGKKLDNRFDDFSIELFQESDNEWLARFEELPNVSAYGDGPEQALEELAIAWQTMKASYREHGDPVPIAPARKIYSGQFNVRIDKRIHRALAMEAARVGISLNALVAQKLAIGAIRQSKN